MNHASITSLPEAPAATDWEPPLPYRGLFDLHHLELFRDLCDAVTATRGTGMLIAGDLDHIAQVVAAAQDAARWQQTATELFALGLDMTDHHQRGAASAAAGNQRKAAQAYASGLYSLGLEARDVGKKRSKEVAAAMVGKGRDPKSKWDGALLA